MSLHAKHPARIVSSNSDWQKTIKCTILLKSLVAVMVVTSFGAMASEKRNAPTQPQTIKQASSGTASPCLPPQTKHADTPFKAQTVNRNQRPAGNPSLTPAMALSIALGLRTATGPMVRSPKTAVRSMPHATLQKQDSRQIALAPGDKSCPQRLSGIATYQKLAMEN